MNKHGGMLEQRHEALAVARRVGQPRPGRVDDEVDQAEEEHLVAHHEGDDPGHELTVAAATVLPQHERREDVEQQAPEHERAGLARPQRGDVEDGRDLEVTVLGHVGHGEVVCPYCGETNSVSLDPGSGDAQEYVEDCQVCCQPWRVSVQYGLDGEAAVEVTALGE